jgi:hypothetical protein
VLARDYGLRVVEREIRRGNFGDGLAGERRQSAEAAKRILVAGLRGVQQRLGLLLQLFEAGSVRKVARHHTASMLWPVVRKQAARRCTCRWSRRI